MESNITRDRQVVVSVTTKMMTMMSAMPRASSQGSSPAIVPKTSPILRTMTPA